MHSLCLTSSHSLNVFKFPRYCYMDCEFIFHCRILFHYRQRTQFAIHSLVDGHFCFFQCLAISNKDSRNIHVQVFLWNILKFLLNNLGIKSLRSYVSLHEERANSFPKWLYHLISSCNNVQECLLLNVALSTFSIVSLFKL